MENVLVRVANRLPETNFSVHVCCLGEKGLLAGRLREENHVHPLHKPHGKSLRTILDLARIIRKTRPHLLHTHNLGPLIYGSIASIGGLRPPILHGEHSQLDEDELTAKRLRQRRVLYRCCRGIHTVADSLRRQLVETGFAAEKIFSIVNGVDCERFRPADDPRASRNALGLPPDATVLAAVGRFGEHKRQDMLIKAFETLARTVPNVHLVLVGAGGPNEEHVLRMAADSHVAHRIHLPGFQHDMLPWYQAMDLLVSPSASEGLSNVILEAMACAVPVLCHEACGNREVITDGTDGWVSDLHVPETLGSKLGDLLASPAELRTVGARAREKVLAGFPFEKTVREYADTYRSMAGRQTRT